MKFDESSRYKELGVIPEGWTVRPFKDLIFFQEGPGLRRFQFTKFGMKVLNVTNILGDGLIDMNITDRHISIEEYEKKYKHFSLELNDVVIATSGSTIGKIGIVKNYNLPGIPNTSTIRFNNSISIKEIDQDFLYYFLKSKFFQEQLISHSSGSAQPNVGPTHIAKMFICYPEIEEQKQIARILKSLDEQILVNNQINKTLEEMAKAIFKEWFVDFNFPNATGKFQETEIGKIPVGWKVGKLGDVAEINPKLPLKKGSISKYVEMKDLSEDSSIIKSFREREFSSGSKFQNGDTLFARITPCLENGKTGLVSFLEENKTGWGSTEFIVLRGKGNVGSNFIYCLSRFDPFRNYAVKSMLGSSGRQRVVESMLIEFALAIPPKELLIDFEKLVTPFFIQINNNEKENQSLINLRDTLLPKLMKGEININL